MPSTIKTPNAKNLYSLRIVDNVESWLQIKHYTQSDSYVTPITYSIKLTNYLVIIANYTAPG